MDNISFSQPNGFPLEADATLGFMQDNYVTSLRGLTAAFGDMVIVSGLEPNGSAVTDGWIYLGGDLVFFQGGAAVSSFYIETTVVKKANENGVLIDRYFTKKAKFGTHPTLVNYDFNSLKRLTNQALLQTAIIAGLRLENEVILSGCIVSFDAQNGVFSISEGLVMLDGKLLVTPSIQGNNTPQYLVIDTTLLNGGKFVDIVPSSPYIAFYATGTSQYYKDVLTRNSSLHGEVRMVASALSDFDVSGLGLVKMRGWAICNGENGTIDMRGRTPFGFSPINAKYSPVGMSAGSETATLTVTNMPAHNHSADATTGAVSIGNSGIIRRTNYGENKTPIGSDTQQSGTELDVTATPQNLPMQGDGNPFEILPPYVALLFIQRI